MTTKQAPRPAIVGHCPTCRTRTARGELKDGTVVEATIGNLTPANELRHHMAGTPTYRATWKRAITLDTRTTRDIKLNPAGYDGARIWAAHTCTPTPTRRSS